MGDRVGICLSMFLIAFAASAQHDSTASRTDWFASIHFGTLIPEPGNPASLSVQVMQGIRYDRVRFGVGVGFDSYEYWNLVPVFTGVAYDMMKRAGDAMYIQVNGGYAKAWSRLPHEMFFGMREEGGYFIHPMVGYRLRQGRIALHLTGGYKIQRIHYRQEWIGWGAPVTSVVQDLERVTLQIGIGLP